MVETALLMLVITFGVTMIIKGLVGFLSAYTISALFLLYYVAGHHLIDFVQSLWFGRTVDQLYSKPDRLHRRNKFFYGTWALGLGVFMFPDIFPSTWAPYTAGMGIFLLTLSTAWLITALRAISTYQFGGEGVGKKIIIYREGGRALGIFSGGVAATFLPSLSLMQRGLVFIPVVLLGCFWLTRKSEPVDQAPPYLDWLEAVKAGRSQGFSSYFGVFLFTLVGYSLTMAMVVNEALSASLAVRIDILLVVAGAIGVIAWPVLHSVWGMNKCWLAMLASLTLVLTTNFVLVGKVAWPYYVLIILCGFCGGGLITLPQVLIEKTYREVPNAFGRAFSAFHVIYKFTLLLSTTLSMYIFNFLQSLTSQRLTLVMWYTGIPILLFGVTYLVIKHKTPKAVMKVSL